MSHYSEYRFWSPTLGADAVRLSMFNSHGHEYFMIIPCDESKAYRDSRETALEAIMTAIDLRLDPGEVRVQ